jgi:hypothetical protein
MLEFAVASFGTHAHDPAMAWWIHAKFKDSDGAFSVVVETAQDALAKPAELAESDQVEVAAMDLSGTIIEPATFQAEASQAPVRFTASVTGDDQPTLRFSAASFPRLATTS